MVADLTGLSSSFWTWPGAAGLPWSFGTTVPELAAVDLDQTTGRSLGWISATWGFQSRTEM